MGLYPVGDQECLWTNSWLIIWFYVDDITLATRKEDQIRMTEFVDLICQRYEMRKLGELQWFLGVRVVRDREKRKLWLSQDSYIDKVVKKFHQEYRRSPHTPLPSENLVPHDGQASIQQVYSYQQRVGSINFAACITRPDIAHASSHLAEFSQNPSPKHLDAVDHVIQYLHGTQNYALEFSPCLTGSFLEAFV